MKKMTLFLFAVNLLLSCVLAKNTQEKDFSSELKLEGMIISLLAPWGGEEKEILVSQPICPSPATQPRHERISPRVNYGKGRFSSYVD